MSADENDPRTTVDKATDAVRNAADAVQRRTESVAAAIDDSRRPGGVLDQLSRFTREAPLRALAAAFVIGLIVARKR